MRATEHPTYNHKRTEQHMSQDTNTREMDDEVNSRLYADTPALQSIEGVIRIGHQEKLVVYEVRRVESHDEIYAVIHRKTAESRYIFTVLDDDGTEPLLTFDRYVWYEYEGAVPITSNDGVYPVPAAVIAALGELGYDLELAFG